MQERGQKVALAAHCKVSRQAVDQWLSGEAKPSADLTFKLLNWVVNFGRKSKSPGSASTPPEQRPEQWKFIAMKNTVRIQRKGAKGTKLSQGKSRGCTTTAAKLQRSKIAEPGIDEGCYGGNGPVNLILFDHRTDETVAGCDLSPAQLEHLQALAKLKGVSIGACLDAALKDLSAPPTTPFQTWDELRLVIRESNALQTLFFDAVILKSELGETCYGDEMECGLRDLMFHTQQRLAAAVESLKPATASAVRGATVGGAS